MLLDLYGMASPPAAGLLLRPSAPSFVPPPYPLLIFSGVSHSLLNLLPLAPVLFYSDLDRVGVRLQHKTMECPTRIGLGGHKKGSSTACLPWTSWRCCVAARPGPCPISRHRLPGQSPRLGAPSQLLGRQPRSAL
ncbi:hypothetical protein VPH35_111121 [Triticum aestivum]